jgi:ubiquitin-hydrolase Zn-finger-containing protein
MGLFSRLGSTLRRTRQYDAGECRHTDQIHDVTPDSDGCGPCLALGDTWVHLRMCMTDGQVLCCDSSKNQHASRHAHEHAPLHQIVRSLEPGEDWLWCFTDQRVVHAPTDRQH